MNLPIYEERIRTCQKEKEVAVCCSSDPHYLQSSTYAAVSEYGGAAGQCVLPLNKTGRMNQKVI